MTNPQEEKQRRLLETLVAHRESRMLEFKRVSGHMVG